MTAHHLARPILPAAVAETTWAAAPVPPPAPLAALAGRGRLRIGIAPDADTRRAARLAASAERVAKARAALAGKVGGRDIPGMLRDVGAIGELAAALVLELHAAVLDLRDQAAADRVAADGITARRLDAIEARLDRLDRSQAADVRRSRRGIEPAVRRREAGR